MGSPRAIAQAPILVLPEEVQRSIAETHRSLDTQITQTEALIAKQEQVRGGLMQDLFTRGVDETGRLRPPREEALELYHETTLGWLPKGWSTPLLDSVANRASGHTPSRTEPTYWNGGIKWVSLADSHRLDQLFIQETEHEISASGLRNSSAQLLPSGTVILSRDAGVGKSAIISGGMAVSQHFMAWTCGPPLR
jgi:type I restriction enzyme, S subunit